MVKTNIYEYECTPRVLINRISTKLSFESCDNRVNVAFTVT